MYGLEWDDEALTDLMKKVPRPARRVLLKVSMTALGLPDSYDGRMIHPYGWRRGLTPTKRAAIDAAVAAGRGNMYPDTGDQGWDFILVYKLRGASRGYGYEVLRVYSNPEFFIAWASLLRAPIADEPGPFAAV